MYTRRLIFAFLSPNKDFTDAIQERISLPTDQNLRAFSGRTPRLARQKRVRPLLWLATVKFWLGATHQGPGRRPPWAMKLPAAFCSALGVKTKLSHPVP